MIQRIPLLGVSLLTYLALQASTANQYDPWYSSQVYSFHLLSGDLWLIKGGELFLGLSIALLFIEVVRSTRVGTASITNHALSVLVFVAALSLFLTRPGYGNSVFFLFLVMSAFDFVAGFIITTAGARRDVTVGRVEGRT